MFIAARSSIFPLKHILVVLVQLTMIAIPLSVNCLPGMAANSPVDALTWSVADQHRLALDESASDNSLYLPLIFSYPPPWEFEWECEFTAGHTVGQVIWRSNASGLKVHGQFGTINHPPWTAKSGYVIYVINMPQVNGLYLNLRYSKDSTSSTPIHVYIDNESTPRASFTPEDLGSWNDFTWENDVFLGTVNSGIHVLKLYTDGQQYGVADLDKFVLSNRP